MGTKTTTSPTEEGKKRTRKTPAVLFVEKPLNDPATGEPVMALVPLREKTPDGRAIYDMTDINATMKDVSVKEVKEFTQSNGLNEMHLVTLRKIVDRKVKVAEQLVF